MNIFSHFWQRGIQPILRRFRRDNRGVVAVETALLIPIGVFVIIASWELYQYFRTASVVDRAAFMVANSLSMQRELYGSSDCTLANSVCTYNTLASDLLTPLDYNHNGGMVISLYKVTSDENGDSVWSACWSEPYNHVVSQLTPPAGFPTPAANDSVIAVEVFYNYTPFAISSALWQALGGEKRIVSEVFYRPRFSSLCVLE
ncbi:MULTISPECIES: TadE/TadG family type IV pilus assembly protein [unclassified Brenneria]|uniref:TadE/TadG family type IV pilus assembly protein n=1 Tax=unclassified Brenneria TaxID=2634434 RepID=UPI0029C4B88D|nr:MULTISPECIES: TadE/TadG family type IV pilus assembly protein [unclassified Brenneria]MDX5628484.1 TadE/TadG family type IV pilus assembly protein [Brenneria sp. L3-3Z]MDX5695622.1 TadE/TadG family type IV pilus assembly protein [Brenneria sp. L4-2C]